MRAFDRIAASFAPQSAAEMTALARVIDATITADAPRPTPDDVELVRKLRVRTISAFVRFGGDGAPEPITCEPKDPS